MQTSSPSGKPGEEAVAEEIRIRAYEHEEPGAKMVIIWGIGSERKTRFPAEPAEPPPDPKGESKTKPRKASPAKV